ncbi:MAG: 3-deoxy-D-manno-octulosonic acid transferase [Ignavibacteria bacterium CG22_combo_CG10-13_8_21_14_all_37_15]|nr:MAG: 3-deoxy-D-manno-octulosonic acid transferase [Ignavibacteria bacterium CG22_combo_CG10-13_8_21_14_all_37_15]
MDLFWKFAYNILIVPLLLFAMKIAPWFNQKVKIGVAGRKRLFEELIVNMSSLNKKKKLIWFHSSSLGEFEQAKPIIEKLKQAADVNILVTFFSPSGLENSKKYPFADLVSYLPLDTTQNAARFISLVNPSLLVLMRYDLWPNHIYELAKRNIPIFLVDATMRSDSARKNFFAKKFHKHLYGKLSKILTVSETDALNFGVFEFHEHEINPVGDTRFDRVYQRSLVAKERNLIRSEILKDKKVIVAGSTWYEDEETLLPAFMKLTEYDENVLMIIAPHEPTVVHLEKLENDFTGKIKTIRFSSLNNYKDEKIILVDSIGILLTLYYYANIAFVGGSFKSNIHNVLEAAVYGVPVIFGPKITNSQEAIKLAELGGGIIIKNKKEAYRSLRLLTKDESVRQAKGRISKEYVQSNLGATDKILKEMYKVI